jgi:Xaa-Pro aminopeptidase
MGTIDTQTVNTTDRLAALRILMAERNIDAYIVPSVDQRRRLTVSIEGPHPYIVFPDFSEYSAECDKRRAFISGFNGSAGLFPQCLPLSRF